MHGQATPDTENLFTSVAETNQWVHKAREPRGALFVKDGGAQASTQFAIAMKLRMANAPRP